MTSWYSKLYSTTTSQISSLQHRLLASEADGDTEDDTHVCRVLRAYYAEKGEALPSWLPPDPKAPPPPPAAPPAGPTPGSRYGNLASQTNGAGGAAATSSLSSLWDSGSSGSGRGGGRGGGGGAGAGARGHGSARGGGSGGGSVGRPDDDPAGPRAASVGGVSAQDRLRRMYGQSRTTSPGSSQGPFAPPSVGAGGGQERGGRDYEDRFAPDNYKSGGGGQPQQQPYLRANAPWVTDDPGMGMGDMGDTGGGLEGGRQARAGGGLPRGPRQPPSTRPRGS